MSDSEKPPVIEHALSQPEINALQSFMAETEKSQSNLKIGLFH